jgi:hypothetical protein
MGVTWNDLQSYHLEQPLRHRIERNAGEFNCQGTAIILWALAILLETTQSENTTKPWDYLKEKRLANLLLEAISRNHLTFNPQHISRILSALATLIVEWNVLGKDLQDLLFKSIAYNVKKFNMQDISNTLWALAIFGLQWEDLQTQNLDKPLLDAIKRNINSDRSESHATQIRWAQLWFNFPLEKDLEMLIINALGTQLPQVSESQNTFTNQLRKALPTTKIVPEDEITPGMHVDICIKRKPPLKPLAIEFDGPFHTVARDSLKTRLLEKLGYEVVRVSYQELSCLKIHDIKQLCATPMTTTPSSGNSPVAFFPQPPPSARHKRKIAAITAGTESRPSCTPG